MNKQEIEKAIELLQWVVEDGRHRMISEETQEKIYLTAISALTQQLTHDDEVESLRNWNACEKEEYADLLKSDKRRIELEVENEELRQQLNNGWIPVTERLPEEETTYIVAWVPASESVQCGLSHYYGMFEFIDGDFDIDVPELFKEKEIIIKAWRPLPPEYTTYKEDIPPLQSDQITCDKCINTIQEVCDGCPEKEATDAEGN